VREVKADGQLGPIQRLLVQHTDNTTAISSALAAKADLIATCNPKALPLDLQRSFLSDNPTFPGKGPFLGFAVDKFTIM
jgi:hypothetical protein